MRQKKIILLLVIIVCTAKNTIGQDFITRVKIEFEKKVNLHQNLSGDNADRIKDAIPKYDITYFNFAYAGNVSLYQYDHDIPAVKTNAGYFSIPHQQTSLFINYTTKQTISKRSILMEDYIIKDTLGSIKWKITQETRNIVGYQCRKAIGRIYDSVYIVAFYCEQFIMKGGPEGIQGLPGMILGMAIPRYNTTWFATKIELANIDESAITPPTKGKKMSEKELTDMLMKRYKEFGMKDVTPAIVKEAFKGYLL